MIQTTLSASLMIGIPSIDREHEELITSLNSILNNPNALLGSDTFSEYLSQLGQQLATHFTNEERFLIASGMPADDITHHIHAHSEILKQYTQLNLDLMRGNKVHDKISVLVMIKDWIVTHVICCDLKIRDCLPENDLTQP